MRRFSKDNTVQDLVNYWKHETKDMAAIELLIPFPKKDISDLNATLQALNFAKQETVMVKKL